MPRERKSVKLNGRAWQRVRWGDEEWNSNRQPRPCPDCGVAWGALHSRFCQHEECPRCQAQLISCNCEAQETIR